MLTLKQEVEQSTSATAAASDDPTKLGAAIAISVGLMDRGKRPAALRRRLAARVTLSSCLTAILMSLSSELGDSAIGLTPVHRLRCATIAA